jgi:hypothetical protein
VTATGAFAGRAAAVEAPPFIDCAGWGARTPSAPVPVLDQPPVKILVHHTATPNVADLSRGAAERLARGIQNFHMDQRGWIDSGQHLTISRGGFVLEGRHRTLEVLAGGRQQVEAAHCTGQNTVSIGIENEGTYIDTDPPPELWHRLRQTCAHLCARYGIVPTAIYGHRDFKDTACPGDRLYGLLPRLREEVGGMLGRRVEGAAARPASWPLLRPGDTGGQVLAAQLLLRAAGFTGVAPTGVVDATTDRAIRDLQIAHAAEEVNGLLGAESWPVLIGAVERAGGADVERAVRLLAAARRTEALAEPRTVPDWQRLLGTAGPPVDPSADPPGLLPR